jgi:hypothetical protein
VGEREREHHRGADPGDQQDPRQPADAGERDAVLGAADAVAKPETVPSAIPTDASPAIRSRSLPAVGSACRYIEETQIRRPIGITM